MTRAILLVALTALLVGGIVRADDRLMLPGNRIKIEDALDKSDTVFVGEITFVGEANLKTPGAAVYFGTQAKVLRILQGTFRPESTFTLFAVGTTNYVEHPPRVGNSYIIFVRRNTGGWPDPYTGVKLISATHDNVAMVKNEILTAIAL